MDAKYAAALICRGAVDVRAGHVPEIESRWRDIRRSLLLASFRNFALTSKKSRHSPIYSHRYPPSFFSFLLSFFPSDTYLYFSPQFFPLPLFDRHRGRSSSSSEVNATRRDITSFPLNSPLSIRAISRQRSDRYNRFGLIPVNCRRPKFTSRVPREQAISHLRQTSTRPIQRHLNNVNRATRARRKRFRSILFRSSLFPRKFREEGGAFPRWNFAPRRSTPPDTKRGGASSYPGRFSTNLVYTKRVYKLGTR